jgi:sodium transport system permease protein
MNFATLRELLRCDLRLVLRDRRTLFFSLILPILLMPIFFFIGNYNEKRHVERLEELDFKYVVVGSQASWARALLAEAEAASAAAADAEEDRKQIKLVEIVDENPRQALFERRINVVVETFDVGESWPQEPAQKDSDKKEQANARAPSSPDPLEAEVALPSIRLVFEGDWDYSSRAMAELRRRLEDVRLAQRQEALEKSGVALRLEDIAKVGKEQNIASSAQRTGALLGRFAFLYALLFLLTGGSVVAADTLAGEKERGTLETLLTSAAGRAEIVGAKLLLIFLVGTGIVIAQVLNLWVYSHFDLIELPASFAVELGPAAVIWLILLFIPMALLVAGILLVVSGRSHTYKEFQQSFFPISLLVLAPAALAALPGVELRSAVAILPIANLSVAVREILVGKLDWPFLILAWLTSMAAALITVRATLKTLSTESLVTASVLDRADLVGGKELFRRHVPRIFAVMWALLFVASSFEAMASIKAQLFFNLILVFFGGSLLMIWRYRLDPTEALALRPVKPIVWIATLIGAPALLLTGVALAKLSLFFVPVPREILESFGQSFSAGDIPFWQMLVLFAVLPGFCEEIAFRGVLLHGLARRFHPLVLCLVVGLVFGLFHFALFRLASTAFLGACLAALTLATGSVFPAMLWHALNNALALFAAEQGLDLTDLDPWTYGVATLVVALAATLIWRARTPYPGLRKKRPS